MGRFDLPLSQEGCRRARRTLVQDEVESEEPMGKGVPSTPLMLFQLRQLHGCALS